MTAVAQRRAIGAATGLVGAALAVLAGVVQVLVGSRIPEWSGAKDDPVVLGLFTVVLGAIALAGARSRRGEGAGSPGRHWRPVLAVVAIGIVVL